MLKNPTEKYRPHTPISLPDRRWPEQQFTRAPRWLSTDLRDGNQADGRRTQAPVLGSAAGLRL